MKPYRVTTTFFGTSFGIGWGWDDDEPPPPLSFLPLRIFRTFFRKSFGVRGKQQEKHYCQVSLGLFDKETLITKVLQASDRKKKANKLRGKLGAILHRTRARKVNIGERQLVLKCGGLGENLLEIKWMYTQTVKLY